MTNTVDREYGLERKSASGDRKARIDRNRCADEDDGKEHAVFKHTNYLGRWYYDGYVAFTSPEDALAFRDRWINHED